MKRPERVEDYLEHIAEAIDRATMYLQPIQDVEAFKKNPQAQDAVVRNIENIGEAVSKIGSAAPDFLKQHPELPWAQMREMRNVAIHEYFSVNLEIVWNTVKEDSPPTEAASRGLAEAAVPVFDIRSFLAHRRITGIAPNPVIS